MKTYLQKSTPASLFLAVLGFALLQPLAFAQTSTQPSSESMSGAKTGTAPMSGDAMDMISMDMKGMMKSHQDKVAAMKMTGNVDVDFAMMMRHHHQGAIDMAQSELREGKNPQMRKLAQDIIAAQKKEIAQLDKFLSKNGQPSGAMTK